MGEFTELKRIMSKVVIFSPGLNVYSETFIQAHRKLNNGDVVFVHGPLNDLKVEGVSILTPRSRSVYIVLSRIQNSERNLATVKALKKVFKRNEIQSILIEYGTYAAELWPYLKEWADNILVHFHGYDASDYKVLEKYREVYKEMAKETRGLVVVSEAMKKEMINIGVDEDKIYLNHYGANPIFLKKNPTKVQNEEFLLFAVGRFVPKKAPYYLVLLVHELLKVNRSIRMRIAGNGPLLEVCQNLARYYKVEDNIDFLGSVKPEVVAEEMQNADCFVQHSVRAASGDMEGTPLAILEACLSAKAIVSTKHAGIKDVIIHGETGFLVDEHDLKKMVEYVNELISDEKKRKEIGEAARKRVSEHFSLERHLGVLEELLR